MTAVKGQVPQAIEAHHLSKRWRRHSGHSTTLLHDVKFSLAQGEKVALLGRSGAGKSSLLHLCAGLDDAYEGSLCVLGHNLTELGASGRSTLRRRHMGFASQQGGLVRNLSVLDNITMPLWLDGRPAEDARALQTMALLDISHLAHSAPQDLSGGEVARVALARALQHKPQLVLCDEPTHALDSERRERVIEALRQAAAHGITLLVATHDDHVAAAMDRHVTLHEGALS